MEPKATDLRYRTTFDGDEIDGKRYGLGAPVTKLDAATGTYLTRTGRLELITEEHYARLVAEQKGAKAKADAPADAETDAERKAREKREAEAAELEQRTAAAQADFDAGKVPDDLIDPDTAADAKDRLVAKDKLVELATAAGVTVKSSASKPELAVAIMASRPVPTQ